MTHQQRTEKTLATVEPRFAALVRQVLDTMREYGYPMVPYDGFRTRAQQEALYRQGRFGNPGKIITDADGTVIISYHQRKLAVDCTFLLVGRQYRSGWALTWDRKLPWELYGETAEKVGLSWGGRWRSNDGPHIELKEK